MKKRRILYVENSRAALAPGGSHRSLHVLLEGLDRHRYEPLLLFNQPNPRLSMFDDLGVPLHFIDHQEWSFRHRDRGAAPQPRRPSLLKSLLAPFVRFLFTTLPMTWKCVRIIRRLGVDVVHTNSRIGSNQHAILAGWLLGRKVVAHERWWTENSMLNRFAARRADRIICISEFIRERLLALGPDINRVRVIRNGRRVPAAAPGSPRPDGAERRFIAGMIGTIDQFKGQHVFVEGAVRLLEEFPEMRFLVFGDLETADQSYVARLREAIRSAGAGERIELRGYTEDVQRELGALDAACYLTVGDEPLGGMVEAMMSRTAVIASNSGGIPEVVTPGETGLLVDPGSVEGFVGAVRTLCLDRELRERLADNGYHFAVEHLSQQAYVREVEAVYGSLLEGGEEPGDRTA